MRKGRGLIVPVLLFLILLVLVLIAYSILTNEEPIITGNVVDDISWPLDFERRFNAEAVNREFGSAGKDNIDIPGNLKIASWNLQGFGDRKSQDYNLLTAYADIMKEYDIIFIQEIKDSDSTSFFDLCRLMEGYECYAFSRAGREESKEQYGVIYADFVELYNFKDYNPDFLDRWERPPVRVDFRVGDYEFESYNIHVNHKDVKDELTELDLAVADKGNVIILGTLNADCDYYDVKREVEFDSWNWVIGDEEDTMLHENECSYDRILLNDEMNKEFLNSGVLREGIDKELSDHYLVWVEIALDDFVREGSSKEEVVDEGDDVRIVKIEG